MPQLGTAAWTLLHAFFYFWDFSQRKFHPFVNIHENISFCKHLFWFTKLHFLLSQALILSLNYKRYHKRLHERFHKRFQRMYLGFFNPSLLAAYYASQIHVLAFFCRVSFSVMWRDPSMILVALESYHTWHLSYINAEPDCCFPGSQGSAECGKFHDFLDFDL